MMFFGRGKGDLRAFVSINYGSDRIRQVALKVPPGTSVLDALLAAADVEISREESAVGGCRSQVASIDGFSNDIDHVWLYYVFERGGSSWRIPKEMADGLMVSEGMRIGWRLYNLKEGSPVPKEGPLWSSRCASKTRTCGRKFS